jgi:hypothetical protein
VLPYGFVPIDITRAVADKPVLHDGSGDGSSGGALLSGEILCSMETLTPLLPGNIRYPVNEADNAQLEQWGFNKLPDDKRIAEPLRLEDGRIVIAGSALKGMIRMSLSALLSAPMERVKERHFTYRPNLDFTRNPEKYVVRPAVVEKEDNGGWSIKVFDDARAADFRTSEQKQDYRFVGYKPGIDGNGLLAKAFGTRTYRKARVPKTGGCDLQIPADLYKRYLEDQKNVLANDTEGHLTAHPLNFHIQKVKEAIVNNSKLQPGQLIYVEVEVSTDSGGNVTENARVVSFGHHFRYRWAYTSSIRKKDGQLRDCLAPTVEERELDAEGAPQKLTGARLLFGYVRDNETNPIGNNAFERLAGRIAINHAVSVGVPGFLGQKESGYCVSLPILGQPVMDPENQATS